MTFVTCSPAVKNTTLQFKSRATCKDREVKEVYKSLPAYSSTTPSSFALTQMLSWFIVWCTGVDVENVLFAPDFYLFTSSVQHSTTPNLSCPTPLAFIFTPFIFPICIYDPNFYLSEAMIIPGCCSQSVLCSHWNSVATGWGRVAHSLSSGLIASVVLWMLWGTAGLICLSPVEQRMSETAWNSLQNWSKLYVREKKKNHI